MTLPRYPAYRDSGVEWLGEVPAHWEVIRLVRISVSRCDGPFGSGLKSEHYTDEGARVIRLQNIRDGAFDGTDEAFIDLAYFSNDLAGHDVEPDDILIAGLGDDRNTVGRACVAPSGIAPALVKADCFRFRLDRTVALPKFIAAVLTAGAAADAGILATGSTRSRIPLSTMGTRKVGLPPLDEQAAIAAFLDRETAKIDGLVREQERLIELLAEKRRAVVSHAVTKGLDRHAPMKDSGIDWLGEVPAHWEVMQLKRDLEFLTSGSRGWAEHYADDGALFIRIGNLTRDGIGLDLSDIQRVAVPEGAEGARTRLRTGDVLFSITAYLGSVAVVPEDLEEAYVSQHVALARLRQQRLLPSWVAFVTLSYVGSTYLGTQGYGGTKIQLSLDDVANAIMTCPPLDEQRAIIAHLDRETAKLDALKAEAERAIALLKERRAALISAAVTGKIDVRGRVEEAA
jgi:type I restriction enzyme S subunit